MSKIQIESNQDILELLSGITGIRNRNAAIPEKVKELSNKALLINYTNYAAGDDYEGNWTTEGSFIWDALQKELEERLIGIGFLITKTNSWVK